MKRILLAGESWTSFTTHVKGFDTFTTSVYEEGAQWLLDAFAKGGYQVDYIRNHDVPTKFPSTMEELGQYDVVILSDCGSNTLLLHPATFARSEKTPNRCELLRDYVQGGGGLCLVGGYMSFCGIDAKTRFGQTAIKDVCPVDILDIDDRVEAPQGIAPVVTLAEHPVFRGVNGPWPELLGYNKTVANSQKGQVVATIGADPLLALGEFGAGRAAAFTSDCSPHWAPTEFCNWECYPVFWNNLMGWLTKQL